MTLPLLLERGRGGHYVEVKNCHMVYPDGNGYCPDSVSVRASRHVTELAELVAQGHKARPSGHHDPAFAAACRAAAAGGVTFRAVLVTCSCEGFTVSHEVEVDLAEYDTTAVAGAWTGRALR
mmetsp:Transcript_20464/g.46972  ORF Transcript_20464/g.46972 Transcript_20464/m.46972 type:complete len:122 (+) Transcript_20464:212-577(+)